MNPIRVIIADDHSMVREGLRSLLEGEEGLEVVGESADGAAALQMIKSLKPDVATVDVSMPGHSGIDVLRAIQEDNLPTKVLILTMYEEATYVEQAIRSGAQGYLVKTAPRDIIITAIRTIARGGIYYGHHAAVVLAGNPKNASADGTKGGSQTRQAELTAREKEIVQLIGSGLSSQEIADRLFVSRRTVDTHRSNIMQKFGLKNVSALIRFAIERQE